LTFVALLQLSLTLSPVALCVTIIVGNGKTPAHRQRQRHHRNEGNNTISTKAKMPAHRQR
jgi:hypothetical protein